MQIYYTNQFSACDKTMKILWKFSLGSNLVPMNNRQLELGMWNLVKEVSNKHLQIMYEMLKSTITEMETAGKFQISLHITKYMH
jgi:hypothetical protein